MTPTEYYTSECLAGRTPESVCDELNSLDCNEDKAYRDACGGIFTPTNIIDAWSKLIFRTETATSTDNFRTSVLLRANINFPNTYGLTWTFQISTSASIDMKGCLLASAVTTTPYQELTANGAIQSVSWPLSNVAIGVYYYQVVVITNCGFDTEESFCGNVVPYTVSPPTTRAPTRAPTPAPSPAPTTLPVCSFGSTAVR